MTKRALKRLYREYIFGTGKDRHLMREGANWDDMIPVFAFGIPEKEREVIHLEWYNRDKIAA
jgi:hypothetical protein